MASSSLCHESTPSSSLSRPPPILSSTGSSSKARKKTTRAKSRPATAGALPPPQYLNHHHPFTVSKHRMMTRINANPSQGNKVTLNMQRKAVEHHRLPEADEPIPDIAELMDDWFCGNTIRTSLKKDKGRGRDGRGSSETSKLMEEWLEEAKRKVSMSPSRCSSPTRLVGSPRFAAAKEQPRNSLSMAMLDRRDPLSRSARRHRSTEGISDEILSRTARHSRNMSENFASIGAEKPPVSSVQQQFTSIIKQPADGRIVSNGFNANLRGQTTIELPAWQSMQRKSRFRDNAQTTQAAGMPIPPKRAFTNDGLGEYGDLHALSPPRNLMESSHRRSMSSSTCSANKQFASNVEKISSRTLTSGIKMDLRDRDDDVGQLNSFLRQQRSKIEMIASGEILSVTKIILSGSSTSTTSSMAAAICYAWMLEKREKKEDGVSTVGVPVINMKRRNMWKNKQAAWLFQNLGIDASALIFSDEVDLEDLLMARQLNILVIGQDVLKTNNKVGSQCTLLTDNYCEEAYDLLQIPILKKLLLAGILLDTRNLSSEVKASASRDAEAVQLLSVGLSPNYRYDIYDQLMADRTESSFEEAMWLNYGKAPSEGNDENGSSVDQKLLPKKPESVHHQQMAPPPVKQKVLPAPPRKSAPIQMKSQEHASREKNRFSLAKWFGFGSK